MEYIEDAYKKWKKFKEMYFKFLKRKPHFSVIKDLLITNIKVLNNELNELICDITCKLTIKPLNQSLYEKLDYLNTERSAFNIYKKLAYLENYSNNKNLKIYWQKSKNE